MKKTFLLFAFVGFLALTVSSCKSHEKCPAYSKVSTEDIDSKA